MSRRRFRPNAKKSIYFIAAYDSLCVKIGVSQDVLARLSELQGANAEYLELLLHFPVDGDAKAAEAELHEAFREYRKHGEWFAPNQLLNQTMLRLKKGEPLDQVLAWLKTQPVGEPA